MTQDTLSVTTDGAAQMLGVSVSTLNRLRAYRPEQSPPWVKLGSRVIYPVDGLRAWLNARANGSGGVQ